MEPTFKEKPVAPYRVFLFALAFVMIGTGLAIAQKATDPSPVPPHDGRLIDPAAQTVEKANSNKDLLRVHIGYARPVNGKLVCLVVAHWGDLDRLIEHCGKEWYSKWDGAISVSGGTVELVRKLAFDDRPGLDPKPGTGIDKITGQSPTSITWQSAVVGATDGLVFRITFDNAQSSAILKAGNFTVDVRPIQK